MSVLNYIATSNHIHLLCADHGNGEISRSMQLIAGRTAQEFNTRKNRRGAFWEDRYHATAVQTDSHLTRCMTYIDLNMVRAQVISSIHVTGKIRGYNEIQRPWMRKGVIDFDLLMSFLNVESQQELAGLQSQQLARRSQSRSETRCGPSLIAVGDKRYLQGIKAGLGARGCTDKFCLIKRFGPCGRAADAISHFWTLYPGIKDGKRRKMLHYLMNTAACRGPTPL